MDRPNADHGRSFSFSLARLQVQPNQCGPLAPPIVCFGLIFKPIEVAFAHKVSTHRKPFLLLVGRLPSTSPLHEGLAKHRGGRGYFNGRP